MCLLCPSSGTYIQQQQQQQQQQAPKQQGRWMINGEREWVLTFEGREEGGRDSISEDYSEKMNYMI